MPVVFLLRKDKPTIVWPLKTGQTGLEVREPYLADLETIGAIMSEPSAASFSRGNSYEIRAKRRKNN